MPQGTPLLKLDIVDMQSQFQSVGVDRDEVTLLNQPDRTTHRRFWGDVANDHAPGAPGKAPVGDQANRLTKALADQRAGRSEHFGHARASFGSQLA